MSVLTDFPCSKEHSTPLTRVISITQFAENYGYSGIQDCSPGADWFAAGKHGITGCILEIKQRHSHPYPILSAEGPGISTFHFQTKQSGSCAVYLD